MIDIEGLMFFDAEWEHVFLQLRFGDQYPALPRPGLDPARLAPRPPQTCRSSRTCLDGQP
ncbi:hypothetical protein [Streptomyces sp. NPDC003719]